MLNTTNASPSKNISAVSEPAWAKLSQKKIYFAHQSVGFNIIDGINDVMKENSKIKLNIVQTSTVEISGKPVFAHAPSGDNGDPASKMRAFEDSVKKGLGDKADIAFFKLCYVDITRHTDVEKVFVEYKTTMANLKNAYPDTVFVHVTAPLTTSQGGMKSFIKQIIGKDDNNIKRNQFNDLLLKEYSGKEPVFDLARAESTYANGERAFFEISGKKYFALVPEYTSDGGHLNETGRRAVAKELLLFLAELATNN